MTWKQMKRAWRRAEENRMMTFSQLAALAGGLVCSVLICLWVADERRIDHFGENDARLFQVLENTGDNGVRPAVDTNAGPLAEQLSSGLPEVERAVPVKTFGSFEKEAIVSVGDTELYARLQFAGQDYFRIFSFPFIEGDAANALTGRNQVAISKTLAEKLFGRSSGVTGRLITCNQQDSAAAYRISAVFDNSATRLSEPFDLVLSYGALRQGPQNPGDRRTGDTETFLLLRKGTDAGELNAKLASMTGLRSATTKAQLFIQNFPEKHLHNQYKNGKPSGGRIEYVTLFSVVAYVILFIVCINFVGLATAFADRKARSADDNHLPLAGRRAAAWWFFAETVSLCVTLVSLAILFVFFSLPAFNALTGKQLVLHPDAATFLLVFGLTGLTGMAAAYPALSLSGYRPFKNINHRLNQTSDDRFLQEMHG